jgi:hypothetical protein
LRCATPPVIHNAAASAAILLSQNNLLRNSTDILLVSFEFSTTRLYFFVGNMEMTETQCPMFSAFKNKGAGKKNLRRLRTQSLEFKRVLIIAILFIVLLILYAKMEK